MIQMRIEQSYFTERNFRLAAIAFLIVGVAGFFGFESKALFAPTLDLIAPVGDISIRDRAFDVVGATDPDADVTVNGRPVFSGETGEFSERIQLFPGVNPVTVLAKNRYGRATAITRFIVVE